MTWRRYLHIEQPLNRTVVIYLCRSRIYFTHIATPNYAMLAWLHFHMPRYQTLDHMESNKSLFGFNLIGLYDRVEIWRSMLSAIQALHLQKPAVGATFLFSQMKDAVRALQSGTTTGKVVANVWIHVILLSPSEPSVHVRGNSPVHTATAAR